MKPQLLTSFDIYCIAAELQQTLTGKQVDRIIITSNGAGLVVGGRYLIFSVIQGAPYIMLKETCPGGRPWLTRIAGGFIESITQVQTDRLLEFKIAWFDKLGKRKDFKLFFELYANGNILLTDPNNKIISSFRKINTIGSEYAIDKPAGFNILTLNETSSLSQDDCDNLKTYNLLRFSLIMDKSPSEILQYILEAKKQPLPTLLIDDSGQIAGYAVYPPPYKNGLIGQRHSLLLDVVNQYVQSLGKKATSATIDFTRQLKKAEKKLEAIKAELSATSDYKILRQFGELILANLYNLKKGQSQCELFGHYETDAPLIKIPLDSSLNPRQNAELYFTKARKLESAIPIINQRLERQQAEIAKIKMEMQLPEKQISKNEFKKAFAAPKQQRLPFRQFDLGNGWLAYSGKTAKSNDELTFGFAHKDDLWFHAWQAFGSHLILRAPQKGLVPDNQIILKAASLAAYYSKAKNSSKVPIIYTEVRYLRKVKKVAGKVIYTNEKELMVEPQSPENLFGRMS